MHPSPEARDASIIFTIGQLFGLSPITLELGAGNQYGVALDFLPLNITWELARETPVCPRLADPGSHCLRSQ